MATTDFRPIRLRQEEQPLEARLRVLEQALMGHPALTQTEAAATGGTAPQDFVDRPTATLIVQEAGTEVDGACGTLNFGAGFDLTNPAAGEADVGLDLSEVVTGEVAFAVNVATVAVGGDLTGTASAAVVAAIHETGGPTKLTAGTIADGEYLKRVGSTLVSGVPSGTSTTGLTPLGYWSRDDITNFTGSDVELPTSTTKGANDKLFVQAPKAGTLTRIAVELDGTVGGGSETITLTVYVNGVASALTTTLSAPSDYKKITAVNVTVAQGDEITVYGQKSGTVSARLCRVTVFGTF